MESMFTTKDKRDEEHDDDEEFVNKLSDSYIPEHCYFEVQQKAPENSAIMDVSNVKLDPNDKLNFLEVSDIP